MNSSVKALTRSALSAAAGLVVLYVSCILPWGKLALLCAAAVGVIFVRTSCAGWWATGCYCVTALLGLLLLPEKAPALAYALFFGYYPLIRLRTERISSKWARIGLRLAVFNAAAALIWFAFRSVITALAVNVDLDHTSVFLLLLAANGVFLVYDYALGQMMLYCVRNISGRFKS